MLIGFARLAFGLILVLIIGQKVAVGFLVNAEQDFTGFVLQRENADYPILFINPFVELWQVAVD